MTSDKENRERLREIREEKEVEERASERKKLAVAYTFAGLLAIFIIGAFIFGVVLKDDGEGSGDARVALQSGQTNDVELDERAGTEPPPPQETDLKVAASEADCEVRAKLPIEGKTHLPLDSPEPRYKTNPPTSGNHVEPPYQQADGAYAEPPEQMNVVHSLEHGRLVLQYNEGLSEEEQLELRGLYDSAYSAALLFPNPELDHDVAVSSWGEMLVCDSYQGAATLDAIRAFGAEYQGTSPEPLEAFGGLPGPMFAGKA